MNLSMGFTLGIISGAFSGAFALPMKYTRKWKWENTWLIHCIWALIIIPWLLALCTVPHLFGVLGATAPNIMWIVFLFGAGWGLGNVFFGMGINALGLALSFAIMMGLINALGTLLPLVIFHPEDVIKPIGLAIIIGVVIMLCGIAVVARAGSLKEKILSTRNPEKAAMTQVKPFKRGLIICILAGILSPSLNFAFVWGEPMRVNAVNMGATSTLAPNVIWVIALLGGFIVNLGYCGYLLSRNKNWGLYKVQGSRSHWLFTFLMGSMWMGQVAFYGMAAANLGPLGSSIGWPIFQSMSIITANVLGAATGEWKDTGKRPITIMVGGLILLATGMGIIGWGSTL